MTPNANSHGSTVRARVEWALSLLRPTCAALITPQAVALETGSRKRPLMRQSVSLTGSLEERFFASVTDFLQLMDDLGVRGRRLHLVVSDFWARPLVLPFQGKVPNDEAANAALQSQYRRTYGELMDGWSWCWAAQGTRLLAVAWPAAALTALRHGVAQRACVLATARPLAIDVASGALLNGSSWLAIMERQSVTLVREEAGVWEDWCVLPSDDLAESLPTLLARVAARRHDDCRALKVVDLSGTSNSTLLGKTLNEAGWSVRVCGLSEMQLSMACRLSQAITSGASA